MLPHVIAEMQQAGFWTERTPRREHLLLDQEEITAYNRQVIGTMPDRVKDLAAEATVLSRLELLSLMPQELPVGKLLVQGESPSPRFWQQLAEQINREGIARINPVGYGLTVRRSNLRRFPTPLAVTDAGDPEQDLFQESALRVGEPLLLFHHSSDRNWLFVQAYYYRGWVRAEEVALCERRDWLAYQSSCPFLTVTGSSIRLCANPNTPQLSRLELGMGCQLPLARGDKGISLIDGQATEGNYVIILPHCDRNGWAEFKAALVPRSRDLALGYLPYTRENLIKQAFKMLGERYGWGGSLGGRDCSSLIMDLFACFGFRLPRNSSDQAKLPGRRIEFGGKSLDERCALLMGLAPGALLFFPGHVMLFLGEYEGRYYVLSAVGSYGRWNNGTLERVLLNGVVVSELTLLRPNEKMWLEELTEAVTIGDQSFL